jgi:hypothetical protein
MVSKHSELVKKQARYRYEKWEDLAVTAPLLLPRARRRLHQTTLWRCGWWLLLL